MRKGCGILESSWGRPISSDASRRAVSQGVSDRVSDFPPGNAAWPSRISKCNKIYMKMGYRSSCGDW